MAERVVVPERQQRLPAVTIAGATGLTRDLATLVLARTGFSFAEPPGADVILLVDPGADHLEMGRRFDLPVVVVTSVDIAPEQLTDLVLKGVDAVVHAESTPSELGAAVLVVAEGGSVLPPHDLHRVLEALRSDERAPEVRVTAREIDILRCIDSGASVKQTALALGIAPKTVENLQSRLFRKLGVRNRAHAVSHAHACGLLDAEHAPMPTNGVSPAD